jgi:fumarate hydratase, class I
LLAEEAFRDVSHLLRPSHLELVARILHDPEASDNDKYVAKEMLKNAVIAAEREFPLCQDTGTAIIMGKKGQQVWTGGGDEKALSLGVFNAYTRNNLRYSQNAPLNMYQEKNTGCNLPAQIDLFSTDGDTYKFLFMAKGGGSANKTYLYQETKAVLNPEALINFMKDKMKSLGTAACPPYHLAFVIGGTSAELTLKTVKLASAGYLDKLPEQGSETGHAFRDCQLEEKLLEISGNLESAPNSEEKFLPGNPCDKTSKTWSFLPHWPGSQLQRGQKYQGKNYERRHVSGKAGNQSRKIFSR